MTSTTLTANDASKKPKCLVASCGCSDANQILRVVAELSHDFEVLVVCSDNAVFFFAKGQPADEVAWTDFERVGGLDLVLDDGCEQQLQEQAFRTGDSFSLHEVLCEWADVLIVAPASANVIAKSSYGIADNFVLSVMRAWDFRKPCVLCPAMNTVMWTHPTTQESLTRLRSWGWEVLGPVEKVLACNDKGNGAMVSVQDIKTFLLAKSIVTEPTYRDRFLRDMISVLKMDQATAKDTSTSTSTSTSIPNSSKSEAITSNNMSSTDQAFRSINSGIALGVGMMTAMVLVVGLSWLTTEEEPFYRTLMFTSWRKK